MLRIRLFRGGKKHQPSYKIVIVDKKRAPRGGRFIDIIGFLNPMEKTKSIDAEKAKHWISKGAQPSDTIHNLLVKEGVIKDKKRDVHKKSKKTEEEIKAGAEKKAEKEAAKNETPATPEAPVGEVKEPSSTPAEVPAGGEEKVEEVKEDVPAETPAPEKKKEEPRPETK